MNRYPMKPRLSILDSRFQYVRSENTDIRKTWAKHRTAAPQVEGTASAQAQQSAMPAAAAPNRIMVRT